MNINPYRAMANVTEVRYMSFDDEDFWLTFGITIDAQHYFIRFYDVHRDDYDTLYDDCYVAEMVNCNLELGYQLARDRFQNVRVLGY